MYLIHYNVYNCIRIYSHIFCIRFNSQKKNEYIIYKLHFVNISYFGSWFSNIRSTGQDYIYNIIKYIILKYNMNLCIRDVYILYNYTLSRPRLYCILYKTRIIYVLGSIDCVHIVMWYKSAENFFLRCFVLTFNMYIPVYRFIIIIIFLWFYGTWRWAAIVNLRPF